MADFGNSYVVFHLADEEYGIPVTRVNSIIRYEQATPVPRAPVSVLGVINLRGRIVPVIDLLRRFKGTPFEPGTFSRIVVAEGDAGAVGIAVDSANEVAEFDPEAVRAVPDGVLSTDTARAFVGVVEREGKLVILLDLDEAVPKAEYAAATRAGGSEGENDV